MTRRVTPENADYCISSAIKNMGTWETTIPTKTTIATAATAVVSDFMNLSSISPPPSSSPQPFLQSSSLSLDGSISSDIFED